MTTEGRQMIKLIAYYCITFW